MLMQRNLDGLNARTAARLTSWLNTSVLFCFLVTWNIAKLRKKYHTLLLLLLRWNFASEGYTQMYNCHIQSIN